MRPIFRFIKSLLVCSLFAWALTSHASTNDPQFRFQRYEDQNLIGELTLQEEQAATGDATAAEKIKFRRSLTGKLYFDDIGEVTDRYYKQLPEMYDYAVIQVYFLKKMLASKNQSEAEKIQSFDSAILEINKYYSQPNRLTSQNPFGPRHDPVSLGMGADDVSKLFKLFESPYARMRDEIRFQKELAIKPRILLEIQTISILRKFKTYLEKLRTFDFEVPIHVVSRDVMEHLIFENYELYKDLFDYERDFRVEQANLKWIIAECEYNLDPNSAKSKNFSFARTLNGKSLEFNNYYSQFYPNEGVISDTEKLLRYQFVLSQADHALTTLVGSKEQRRNEIFDRLWEANKSAPHQTRRDLKARLFPLPRNPQMTQIHLKSFFVLDLLAREIQDADKDRNRLVKMSVSDKLRFIEPIEKKFDEQILRFKNIAKEMVQSGQIQFKEAADQRFFEILIENYYDDMSDEMATDLLKGMIERPDLDSSIDIFKLMVLHSGPLMQKLLQVLGRREGFSPELQKIFVQVEDSGLATPWEIDEVRLTAPPEGWTDLQVDRSPMVGTMAQTYRGQAIDPFGNKTTIASRPLKEGIQKALELERPRLVRLAEIIDSDGVLQRANFPQLKPIVDDIVTMATDELNLDLTSRNQILGKEKYHSTVIAPNELRIEFVVPETLVAPHSERIDSIWLEGEKFDNFQSEHPDLAPIVAEEILKKWLDVALFDGFLHADMHQGNIKIKWIDQKTIQVGILDFGMAATLSTQDRSVIMKLGLVAKSNRGSSLLIADYILALSNTSENLIEKKNLVIEIDAHMKDGPLYAGEWLRWSMAKGVKLKPEISSFSRGLTALSQLLKLSGSSMTIGKLMLEVTLRHRLETAKMIAGTIKDRFLGFNAEKVDTSSRHLLVPQSSTNLECRSLFHSD